MRCPRCGNENPETHRFCGMCGASLLQNPSATSMGGPPPGVRAPLATPAPKTASAPVTTRRTAPVSEEMPTISGPSFLGLNQPPPPSARKRGSLSIDPHSAGPGDLDYLLEDEPAKHGGGGWKAVVIFLALVLAVGFGYLRFRNQGLDWLKQELRKPAAQATPAPSDSPAPDAAAPAPSTPTASTTAPATQAPATGPAIQPAPDPVAAAPAQTPAAAPDSPASSSTAPDASAPAPSSAAPAPSQPQASETPHQEPPAAGRDKQTAAKASKTTPKGAAHSKDESDTDSADSDGAESTPPAKPERAPSRKPTAAVRPSVSSDPVADAQRFLYGKGASQDCEHGLRILKPAAEQSNPKAMIEMGALYSAGLCAPRDLPTAYRWFALALRKDPENESVQSDLQKLWGEMTQPERQLAIRLTQ